VLILWPNQAAVSEGSHRLWAELLVHAALGYRAHDPRTGYKVTPPRQSPRPRDAEDNPAFRFTRSHPRARSRHDCAGCSRGFQGMEQSTAIREKNIHAMTSDRAGGHSTVGPALIAVSCSSAIPRRVAPQQSPPPPSRRAPYIARPPPTQRRLTIPLTKRPSYKDEVGLCVASKYFCSCNTPTNLILRSAQRARLEGRTTSMQSPNSPAACHRAPSNVKLLFSRGEGGCGRSGSRRQSSSA
jgi:hypothetical protein